MPIDCGIRGPGPSFGELAHFESRNYSPYWSKDKRDAAEYCKEHPIKAKLNCRKCPCDKLYICWKVKKIVETRAKARILKSKVPVLNNYHFLSEEIDRWDEALAKKEFRLKQERNCLGVEVP